MTNSKIRTLRWIAPVAMAGVLGFAACGGESAAEDARTEARVVSRGSDTHLYNQAEAIAERSVSRGSDTHLYNQADQAERVAQAEHLDRVASARAAAAAEQAELDAKLEGSAKTAGVSSGNRAALAAQAERYVEQLVANAESTQDSSSQEFVPGTRHMPVR
jgi:hypothetical protein